MKCTATDIIVEKNKLLKEKEEINNIITNSILENREYVNTPDFLKDRQRITIIDAILTFINDKLLME